MVAAALNRAWLSEPIPPTGYVPRFLTPAPAGPAPAPAAEPDAIRASAADRVRHNLDRNGTPWPVTSSASLSRTRFGCPWPGALAGVGLFARTDLAEGVWLPLARASAEPA
ncbi:hypothetical protein [Streptomyces dangxiongensis]|uniref:hypothetical protein n=1 Tax=Streptomyces dangxiongensis TaxID=1442032 RepID=UPI001969AE4F|nr:hypothetical protein [Streptomyces dangxiongensis]